MRTRAGREPPSAPGRTHRSSLAEQAEPGRVEPSESPGSGRFLGVSDILLSGLGRWRVLTMGGLESSLAENPANTMLTSW